MLANIMGFLSGKKTYLAAVLTVLVVGLYSFGIIDVKMYEIFVGALAALGLFSLRDAVSKVPKAK